MLLLVAIISILMGLAARWHLRSMQQYRALSSSNSDEGIWVVEFSSELEWNQNTSTYNVSNNAGFTTTIFQAWATRFCDPYYVCNCVVVFMPEHDKEAIEFVSQLKGVEWIVLANKPSDEIVERWTMRFPRSTIMTRDIWDELEEKPNRQSQYGG